MKHQTVRIHMVMCAIPSDPGLTHMHLCYTLPTHTTTQLNIPGQKKSVTEEGARKQDYDKIMTRQDHDSAQSRAILPTDNLL